MVIRTSEGRWAVCPLSLAAGVLAALMWITLLNKCSEVEGAIEALQTAKSLWNVWEITSHFCLFITYLSLFITSDWQSTKMGQSATDLMFFYSSCTSNPAPKHVTFCRSSSVNVMEFNPPHHPLDLKFKVHSWPWRLRLQKIAPLWRPI